MLLGLQCLQDFREDYTYWTNSIANLMQLFWTCFVQAGYMSIDVIFSRFEEIINSLLTRGVSARETFMDVFAVILRIFAGALQSTINLWRASEIFEMIYGGHDTSEASNLLIASDDASSKASEATKAASEASSQEETKAEEEEKATVKAEEEVQSETEVDNTTDWVRIGNSKMTSRRDVRKIAWNIDKKFYNDK